MLESLTNLKSPPVLQNTCGIFHETVGGKKARGVFFLGGVGVRSPEILMDLKRSPPQENAYRIFHETVGGKKARGVIFLGGVGGMREYYVLCVAAVFWSSLPLSFFLEF